MFMEQIRLIKEMRSRDRSEGRTDFDVSPRFMVWENVSGAFSSNNGEDFRAVLEETARVAKPDAVIPRYEGGRWTNAGTIIGDGFSIAWRTVDAQYWGTPQRRRRIALVADFNGLLAPEVLFERDPGDEPGSEVQSERESMQGNTEPGGAERESPAADAEGSFGETGGERLGGLTEEGGGKCFNPQDPQSMRVYDANGVWHSLNANSSGGQSRDAVLAFKLGNSAKARSIGCEEGLSPTLNSECGGNKPAVCYSEVQVTSPVNRSNPQPGDPVPTLNCDSARMICIEGNGSRDSHRGDGYRESDEMYTLNATEHHAICIAGNMVDRDVAQNGCGWNDEGVSYTLNTVDRPAVYDAPRDENTVKAFSQNGEGTVVESDTAYGLSTRQNPCGRGTAMIYGFQPQAGGKTGCAVTEDASPCLGVTQQAAVYDARGNGDGETAPTITGDHYGHVNDYMAVCIGNGQAHIASHLTEEVSQTLNCMHDAMAVMVSSAGGPNEETAATLDASYYKGTGARNGNERTVVAVDCRNGVERDDVNGTLQAKSQGGFNTNSNNVCREGSVVRRLTPNECTRLQSYPDGWVNIGDWKDEKGKTHKDADSPKYRALGNSICLPFWHWLLKRIIAHCGKKTMGSLFDGIGGFTLCWNAAGGETLWASEIEPFCIAVTKKHFGDEDAGIEGDWRSYVELGGD